MRIVAQRALRAEVIVNDEVVGRLTGPGLVLLVGITHDDNFALAEKLASKIWSMRILEGPTGITPEAWSRGDVSASDINAAMLAISQFTLYADTKKGRRPSWDAAAKADVARPIFDHFVDFLRNLGAHVETGAFGEMMDVSLVNHGPVTMILDTDLM